MRWVNDAKARYYRAWLIEDLFGDWTLITVWGGLGSRRGHARSTAVPSYEDGLSRIEEIAKRRRQHGYRLFQDLPTNSSALQTLARSTS